MHGNTEDSQSLSAAPIVALTGFMAAGKSTIGRALAEFLHWHFVDLDCEIERRSALRIHEIFAKHGEAHFRELEVHTLRSILATADGPTVIALGGGTFVQSQNAESLHAHGARIVFLELEIESLLERCRVAGDWATQNPRPLAVDEEAFCALYNQRLPFYRRAELTVRTRGKAAEQVAQEIAIALGLVAATDER